MTVPLRLDRRRPVQREPLYEDGPAVALHLMPDQPVLCFDSQALTERVHVFREGFPGGISYAVKANSSPEVLAGLAQAGMTVWDVASPAEMGMVRAVSREAEFHYHNPVKSRAEITEAFQSYGCRRFAVDSIRELKKITDVLGSERGLEIAVRFVLPREAASSAHDFSTKFGASESEACELLRLAKRQGHDPMLTFHPGSQCRTAEAYVRYIHAAARIAAASGLPPRCLNVGGGFPAPYRRDSGAKLDDFFSAIGNAAKKAFGAQVPALECEPGRALVAGSMSLLTRVKLLRPARGEIFLNDGIYGALLECWQVPELMPPYRAIRDGRVLGGSTRQVMVFGPTCDPLDKLPGKLELPAGLREGDFVEFGTLGAYGSATLTRFNGYGGHKTVPVRKVF